MDLRNAGADPQRISRLGTRRAPCAVDHITTWEPFRMTDSHHPRSAAGVVNPVDDALYDLLQVLVSKCEAIEAYAKYEQDADESTRGLFGELAQDDVRAAERLLEALRTRLANG
jgi:hypothetical protein